MSTRAHLQFAQALQGINEAGIAILRKDLSGGQNTRVNPQNLPENQVAELQNADISIPGQVRAIPGSTLIDTITNSETCFTLLGFEPDGGTNKLRGVFTSGTSSKIMEWNGTGTFSKVFGSGAIPPLSGSFALKVFKTGGDGHVSMFGSSTTNWLEIDQTGSVTDLANISGTGSDSPPRSNVATFFNDRWWILKDNILYYSDALPSDYSTAFSTTVQKFNMTVGTERFLIGIRNQGLICGGKDKIRYLKPSTTPAATDEYGALVEFGCEAGKTAKFVGDDILYLAKDGVRGIFKTQFDTLQYGTSLPLSYPLKDSFDLINWAHIDKACAEYFDNKYFIALPTSSSTYCNALWIYFPASQGWVTISGLSIGALSTIKINGQERLYATSPTDGKVWRMWFGSDFDGTDITYSETGRFEDVGKPFQKKTGGEFHFKCKATSQYTVNFYISLDESEFTKIGELTTDDRSVNFATWTLPFIFKSAGTYTKRINLNSYGRWYYAQYKITCTDSIGDDFIVLERGIRAIIEQYIPNEED